MTETSPQGCVRCGHLIGYHWDGEDEMWCTAIDCTCRGYIEPEEPKGSKLPKDIPPR